MDRLPKLPQSITAANRITSDYVGSAINIQALAKNTKEIERFCTKVENLELPLTQAVEEVLGPVNCQLGDIRRDVAPRPW